MGEGLRNLGPVLPQADGVTTGGIAPWQRRSVARKREVVLRLLRRECAEGLSRELGVKIYQNSLLGSPPAHQC
jgi:hypothetical protein